MIEALRTMYAPVFGPRGSKWFIVIGVIAVLYSTLYAATAANARALTDFLRVNGVLRLRDGGDRTKWIRRFCIAFPLVDLAAYLWLKNPVLMVTIGGFVRRSCCRWSAARRCSSATAAPTGASPPALRGTCSCGCRSRR
jgi:hypothetical protein